MGDGWQNDSVSDQASPSDSGSDRPGRRRTAAPDVSDASQPAPSGFYVPAPGEKGGSPLPEADLPEPEGPKSSVIAERNDLATITPAVVAPPVELPPAALPTGNPSWADLPPPMSAVARPRSAPAAAPAPVFVPAPGADAAAPGPVAGSAVAAGGATRRAPATNAAPAAASPAPPTARKRSRGFRLRRPRFKLRYLSLLILLVPLLLIGGGYLYAKSIFDGVDRVEVSQMLDPAQGDFVNYLLVGSDARDGVDGNRSDTIILLHVAPDGSKMMSIPRDLWVPIAGTGETRKINAAYNGGPQRLVQTVKDALNVPINRYVEVSFDSFGPIVDAMGGIEITFEHQAYDPKSGFQVPSPGTHRLDGFNALGYVRSRHYVEIVDGEEVTDPTGDLGREQRQQTFLMRTFQKMGEIRNPSKLAEVSKALAAGLKIDDAMTMGDSLSLVRRLGGKMPASVLLPTVSDRIGDALVELFGDEAEVTAALDQFR